MYADKNADNQLADTGKLISAHRLQRLIKTGKRETIFRPGKFEYSPGRQVRGPAYPW